jgi:predicted regulator of Ras-like GTPase activity (Roadblock/LC7/MglB family)
MADERLTTLVVSERELADIETLLEKLLFDAHANFGMVLDRSGQLIATKGKVPQCDLVILGALVAGTFASARELAKALNEEDFHVLFQQGNEQHVITTLVEEQWLLSIIFDQRAYLGLVKVLAKETAQELVTILQQVRSHSEAQQLLAKKDVTTSVEHKIDALFRDS